MLGLPGPPVAIEGEHGRGPPARPARSSCSHRQAASSRFRDRSSSLGGRPVVGEPGDRPRRSPGRSARGRRPGRPRPGAGTGRPAGPLPGRSRPRSPASRARRADPRAGSAGRRSGGRRGRRAPGRRDGRAGRCASRRAPGRPTPARPARNRDGRSAGARRSRRRARTGSPGRSAAKWASEASRAWFGVDVADDHQDRAVGPVVVPVERLEVVDARSAPRSSGQPRIGFR